MTAHTRTATFHPRLAPAIETRPATRRTVLIGASFLLEAVIVLGFVCIKPRGRQLGIPESGPWQAGTARADRPCRRQAGERFHCSRTGASPGSRS